MATLDGNDAAAAYLGTYNAGVLWRAIAARGLDASDFQIGVSELRGYAWKLCYEPTGWAVHAAYSLTRSGTQTDLLVTRPDRDPAPYANKTVAEYLGVVKDWADNLKAARSAESFAAGGTAIGPADGQAGENSPFTPAERAEISDQLRTIRDSVRQNYRLSAEQFAAIDNGLEEAEKASTRLGRKDWKSLFYGVVLGLIVNDAIPPDVAQHIFTGVLHGVAHLLGGGVPAVPWMLGG